MSATCTVDGQVTSVVPGAPASRSTGLATHGHETRSTWAPRRSRFARIASNRAKCPGVAPDAPSPWVITV